MGVFLMEGHKLETGKVFVTMRAFELQVKLDNISTEEMGIVLVVFSFVSFDCLLGVEPHITKFAGLHFLVVLVQVMEVENLLRQKSFKTNFAHLR